MQGHLHSKHGSEMAQEYKTIAKPGKGECEEKRSRFLGEAYPVTTEEEIRGILDRVRKQYYDARHHCYAWVLGEDSGSRRASDDGEPQGTAGAPILKVLEGSGCTNALIVVTRYFGGTLLGTGGLVRNYTQAAKAALSDSGIVVRRAGGELELTLDYPLLEPAKYALSREGITPFDVRYSDRVAMKIIVPLESEEAVRKALEGLGYGRIGITVLNRDFYDFLH